MGVDYAEAPPRKDLSDFHQPSFCGWTTDLAWAVPVQSQCHTPLGRNVLACSSLSFKQGTQLSDGVYSQGKVIRLHSGDLQCLCTQGWFICFLFLILFCFVLFWWNQEVAGTLHLVQETSSANHVSWPATGPWALIILGSFC